MRAIDRELHEAVTSKKCERVKGLLDKGADPTYIAGDKYQAIVLANDIEVVLLLIDAGVKINREVATRLMYKFSGSTLNLF